MKKRLTNYLIPVFVMSFAFNIPKFFEATVIHVSETDSSTNVTVVSFKGPFVSNEVAFKAQIRRRQFQSHANMWGSVKVHPSER